MPIEHGELSETRACDGANLNNTLFKYVTRSVNRTRIKRATEIESINIVYETWTNISEQPGWMCVVLCMAHGSSNTNIKAFNVFNILNSIKWLIGTIYFMKKKKVKNTVEKKQYMRRHLFNACTHGLMHSQIYTWHIKYVIVECCSLLSGLRLYNNKLKDFFPIISFAWLLFH